MGAGDELLAAGEAQQLYEKTGESVAILDRHGRPRWHDVWNHNPAILPPVIASVRASYPAIVNASHARPYIRYPFDASTGWTWTEWRAQDHRPVLHFSPAEQADVSRLRAQYGNFLLVEPSPTIKNPNRAWLFDRWRAVVRALDPHAALVQPWHKDSHPLPKLQQSTTTSFRQACVLLAASSGLVSTEGGLAHAAAAVGTPAVVLFGGCVSATVMAYPDHTNLVDDDSASPCGRWQPCVHCAAAWDRLTVDTVVAAVLATLV